MRWIGERLGSRCRLGNVSGWSMGAGCEGGSSNALRLEGGLALRMAHASVVASDRRQGSMLGAGRMDLESGICYTCRQETPKT